jgi:hypothetical protein
MSRLDDFNRLVRVIDCIDNAVFALANSEEVRRPG